MSDEDYYKILDVPRSATAAEIQKAYRKLAKKYHPDLHEDKERAKQRFQQIQQAYDVLGDDEKRKMYDRFGPRFEQMRGPGGQPFGGPGGGVPEGMEIDFSQLFGGGGGGPRGGFEDIFRQFGGFGRGGGEPSGPPPEANLDIEMDITVPFAVAVNGGEHRVTIERHGKPESLAVKIPAGIENGKKVRLRNQGAVGRNRQGDLLIRVSVAPHPFYQRQGLHLRLPLPITLSEALLGTKIDIPTPHGQVSLKVPPGCSSGRVLRLKGMGIRTAQESGDLLAEVEIVVPDNLPTATLERLKACMDEIPYTDPRADLRW